MESILAKALGQDVTQMAVAEKQLLLSRLLARLAHEIRNPLSSLDIHVQLLEEDLGSSRLSSRRRRQAASKSSMVKSIAWRTS
jgi:two-component system sensor histidine kinase HydH